MSNFKKAYTLDQNKQKVYVGKTDKSFEIPKDARGYKDYIDALYDAAKTISPIEVTKGADLVAERMINDIINSESTIRATGKTYYISNNGDDNADGLSPETAWATTQKLMAEFDNLNGGDAVLFERGSEWRKTSEWTLQQKNTEWDEMSLFVAKKDVSYGAYGVGPKPILNGSEINYADPKLWEKTDMENIYVCKEKFWNPGGIVLNPTGKIGYYDEKVAVKELIGLRDFNGLSDLKNDESYYFDPETEKMYYCSKEGNPGDRYDDMEISGRIQLIRNHGATIIENFDFRFAGYGITGGPSMNVKNCIFSYLGGCYAFGIVPCGNAIEIYGNCDGFHVESCWMYELCDTAVTHQMWHYENDCIQKNITFRGNVMEHCHWGIEFNNPPANDGSERLMQNYDHSYNVIRRGGECWADIPFCREEMATLYACFGSANTLNGLCEKNIFDRATGGIYRTRLEGDKKIYFKDNLNIQFENAIFGYFYDDKNPYPYDENAPEIMNKTNKNEGQVYIYLEK
ncbi:MAG: hypothetical protein E7561_05000 [Ruminococcaceae bacterium]|nr:hypothetical protein [Oscillospiraceae bacterium]